MTRTYEWQRNAAPRLVRRRSKTNTLLDCFQYHSLNGRSLLLGAFLEVFEDWLRQFNGCLHISQFRTSLNYLRWLRGSDRIVPLRPGSRLDSDPVIHRRRNPLGATDVALRGLYGHMAGKE